MTITIKRPEKPEDFINKLLEDSDISFDAKGLILYLMTRKSDTEIYYEDIQDVSKESLDQITKLLFELDESEFINLKITLECLENNE